VYRYQLKFSPASDLSHSIWEVAFVPNDVFFFESEC